MTMHCLLYYPHLTFIVVDSLPVSCVVRVFNDLL